MEEQPHALSEEQRENISKELQEGLDRLRQKQEAQEASESPEDNPESHAPPNDFQSHTEQYGSLQENFDNEWQDSYEGLEETPGPHTTADFERLLKLGQADTTFEVSEGNQVSIRTLNQNEELEAMRRSAAYPQNMQGRIYLLYCAAQSIQALNGKPWYRRKPLSQKEDLLEEKFNSLCDFNSSVLDIILREYRELSSNLLAKAQDAKKG